MTCRFRASKQVHPIAMKYTFFTVLATALVLSSCSSDKGTTGENPVKTVSESMSAAKLAPAKKVPAKNGHPSESQQFPVVAKNTTFAPQAPKVPGLRVARVNVPEKVVALTFDDGPHGTLTPRVLDILNRYNAKGTFFMQGVNVNRYPGIVNRMVREGHEPASHTWNHICMTKSSRTICEAQLQKTDEAIRKAAGVAPKLMRPPYGAVNAGLYTWMNERFGYKTILWDVDTNDWRKPGVSTVISRAVNGAKPGSIILVHDIHGSTVDAIEGIVRGLQSRGFRLVTVSDLISIGQRYAGRAGVSVPTAAPAVVPVPSPVMPAVNPEPQPVQPAPAVVAPEIPAVANQQDPAAAQQPVIAPVSAEGADEPAQTPESRNGDAPVLQ